MFIATEKKVKKSSFVRLLLVTAIYLYYILILEQNSYFRMTKYCHFPNFHCLFTCSSIEKINKTLYVYEKQAKENKNDPVNDRFL